MKILDCTIRDGGYYTNWDFDRNLVDTYILACNELPIDYIEVGYRSPKLEGYYGEYFYLPDYVLSRLKNQTTKKLVVILNEKDINLINLDILLKPCIGLVDMIRLAIDPNNFERALNLAEAIKKLGFEVCFNVMYMSKWRGQPEFLKILPEINGIVDYFYMVDSYGGVTPKQVKDTIKLVRNILPNISLGFHGHNNMEMALINTLTAIEEGCDLVDSTFTGMGRGAGNCKTELLLTALNASDDLVVDFNPLTKVVDEFTDLQNIYQWGTNLPYMVSGAHSLPQNKVMDWVSKRSYSFNTIIRALENQVNGRQDNERLTMFQGLFHERALLVGGGDSIKLHKEAIIKYLQQNSDVLVIHSSSKNANIFSGITNNQIFCLVGNEGYRMEEVFKMELPKNVMCLLPSYPRIMGTYIPKEMKNKSMELKQSTFFEPYSDSHTGVALNTAMQCNVKEIFVVGYDGYGGNATLREQELFLENSYMFKIVNEQKLFKLSSLLQTRYKITNCSIYELI
jgi:4-hydroxy 2-oxovalerate aldolase